MLTKFYPISPAKSINGIAFAGLRLVAYADAPDKLKGILLMEDDGPGAGVKLTVNLPDYRHILKPFEYFIKNYSENEPIVRQLVADGVLLPRNTVVPSGHTQIPVYGLDLTKLISQFTCESCNKTFPAGKARQLADPEGLYCHVCANALEGNFDVSLDFSDSDNLDVNVPEGGA